MKIYHCDGCGASTEEIINDEHPVEMSTPRGDRHLCRSCWETLTPYFGFEDTELEVKHL